MPVEIINLQRSFPVKPTVLASITSIGLKALRLQKMTVAIVFVNDRRMRELNTEFRGKRKTTDVLSFFYPGEKGCREMGHTDGEIIISLPRAKKQADDAGISLFDETVNLLIHGLCHIKGYDHEAGDREATLMKKAERRVASHIEQNTALWEPDPGIVPSLSENQSTPTRFKGKIPDVHTP